ncbi:MAG: DUF2273 domain-containing protein [Chitinophagales bacterium]
MEPDWGGVLSWLVRNKGRAIGSVLGLAIGLLIIIVGFWRGLFLAGCVWLGWYIGSRRDAHESLSEMISRLLPPGE